MSTEHLFVFGYEPPECRPFNRSGEGDVQLSTGAFRIAADSEQEALSWGQELARWYVDELFGKGLGDWSATDFASWIEVEPDEELAQFAGTLPVVAFGEYPDIGVIRIAFSD